MSRLEELIKELCPDGVEYKRLSDIAIYAKDRIDASCINEDTYVGVESLLQNKAGRTSSNSVPTTGKVISFQPGDILIGNIRPYLRKIWLSDCNGGTNGDVLTIHILNKDVMDPHFLYYVLSSEQFFLYDIQNSKGAKMPRGDKKAILCYKIPVPPLEVQREIVRILDNFTFLTAELTAELTARKKQYEYYKKSLFSLKNASKTVSIEDIAENRDSMRKPVTKGNRKAGEYPYYGASGIVDYVDDYIYEGDFLLISEDGANLLARVTPIAFSISGKNWVNNHAHILEFNDIYLQRYTEIYLNSIDLSTFISGAAQPKLNKKNLNRIPIPLPEKEEIKKIVDTLSHFEKLCNNISEGLPAEIEARQKQYEYYRDKLLTFKEKEI